MTWGRLERVAFDEEKFHMVMCLPDTLNIFYYCFTLEKLPAALSGFKTCRGSCFLIYIKPLFIFLFVF
jgi:hypothetical protein